VTLSFRVRKVLENRGMADEERVSAFCPKLHNLTFLIPYQIEDEARPNRFYLDPLVDVAEFTINMLNWLSSLVNAVKSGSLSNISFPLSNFFSIVEIVHAQ